MSPPKELIGNLPAQNWLLQQELVKENPQRQYIPDIGKPSLSTAKVTCILLKQLSVPTGEEEGPISSDIPTVPVLRSPPPYGLCVHQTLPPAESVNMSSDNTTDSDNVSGSEVILNSVANAACSALVSVPSMRAGIPNHLQDQVL